MSSHHCSEDVFTIYMAKLVRVPHIERVPMIAKKEKIRGNGFKQAISNKNRNRDNTSK